MLAGQPRPYLVNFWGALLLATKNWLSYEQNTICPYLDISTKYDLFWPINWSNINIFEQNQFCMKNKPKRHMLYE